MDLSVNAHSLGQAFSENRITAPQSDGGVTDSKRLCDAVIAKAGSNQLNCGDLLSI